MKLRTLNARGAGGEELAVCPSLGDGCWVFALIGERWVPLALRGVVVDGGDPLDSPEIDEALEELRAA